MPTTKLDSIKKSLQLSDEMLVKVDFAKQLQQLEQSESKVSQVILELTTALATAKKTLDTSDMKLINSLIEAVEETKIDLESLSYSKLKSYASIKGIDVKRLTKDDLLKELA